MKTFIKNNASMIAAILLPILFAAFFLASKNISSNDIEKPQYDAIVTRLNNNSVYFEISVINDSLSFTFRYPTRDKNGNLNIGNLNREKPQIYYIHADTLIAEPVGYSLPDDAFNPAEEKEGMSVPIRLEKLENAKFSAANIAPDGYEISRRDSGGGNIMTEFYQRNNRSRNQWGYSLETSFLPIRGMDDNRYYNLDHVGWVLRD